MNAIWNLFERGGLVMWPLFSVGVFAFYLIIFKLFLLYRIQRTGRTTTISHLMTHYLNKERDLSKSPNSHSPINRLIHEGARLIQLNVNESTFKETLQMRYETERSKLDNGMSFIATLGEIMPMLGLLGTVSGMIHVFEAITAQGTGDAQVLAGGISEALLTTQVGLAMAIPTLFSHTALLNQIDNIASQLKSAGEIVLNQFYSHSNSNAKDS
jgi:biopolymer transport protein ExbB